VEALVGSTGKLEEKRNIPHKNVLVYMLFAFSYTL
jgi:hypothetical protein